jgi:hypothetical protein
MDNTTEQGTNVQRGADTKAKPPAVDSSTVDDASKIADSPPIGSKPPSKVTDGTDAKGTNVDRNAKTTPGSGGAGIAH